MNVAAMTDDERRAGLRRMRIIATSLLGAMAVIYLLTLRLPHDGSPAGIAWGFVNTASEAGMVGALADWFAVVALFRHPLGLPIPHTALVKRRKDDLGRSLQSFVVDHFLTEAVVRDRLASVGLGTVIGGWLGEPANRRRALGVVTNISGSALTRVRDEDIQELLTETLLPRLRQEQLSPIAGAFLEGIVEDGAHHGLVDVAFGEVYAWLRANPEIFAQVVGERAPRWSPGWLDKTVVNYTYQQALAWARDVRGDKNHAVRKAIDDMLAKLAIDLQHDKRMMARAEDLKTRVLDHPQTGEVLVSLWTSVRRSLLAALADDTSSLWTRADGWLTELGQRLLDDEVLRTRIEAQIADAAGFVVRTYGPQVATIISWTIDRWDADEASQRIELFVGRDLQFIRINGTVVGALAGLVIHAVSLLVA